MFELCTDKFVRVDRVMIAELVWVWASNPAEMSWVVRRASWLGTAKLSTCESRDVSIECVCVFLVSGCGHENESFCWVESGKPGLRCSQAGTAKLWRPAHARAYIFETFEVEDDEVIPSKKIFW